MKIAEKVKEFFHNEGIHSTTIQPEFVELNVSHNNLSSSNGLPNGEVLSSRAGSQEGCALDCPITDEGCVRATCCQTNNKVSKPMKKQENKKEDKEEKK